jgi:hypothetical protein
MVSLFTEQFFKNTHEKQNCFSNPAAGQQKLVDPTNQNQFYFTKHLYVWLRLNFTRSHITQ